MRGITVSGQFVPAGNGTSANPTFAAIIAANPGLTFYSNPNCNNTSPTGAYFNGGVTTMSSVYAMYTGGNSTFTLDADGTASAMTSVPLTVTAQIPGAASKLSLRIPNNFPAESCTPFTVVAQDSAGHDSPVGLGQNITFSISPTSAFPAQQGVYSDSSCVSLAGSTSIAPSTVSSPVMYVRYPSQGQFSITNTDGTALPLAPMTLNADAPLIAKVIAYVFGASWTNGGGYLGFGEQAVQDSTGLFSVYLQAYTVLGHQIMTFSDTDLGPTGVNLRGASGNAPICGSFSVNSGTVNATCYQNYDSFSSAYRLSFTTGGGSGPYPPHTTAEQLVVTKAGQLTTSFLLSRNYNYQAAQCIPLMLQRRATVQAASPVTTSVSPTLGSDANIAAFYTDAACTTGGPTTLNFGESAKIVYAKTQGGLLPSVTADGFTWADPTTGGVPSGSNVAPGAAALYRLSLYKSLMAWACEPVMAVHSDANGSAILVTGAAKNLALTASANINFYSNASCSTASSISNVTIPIGQSAALFYIRSNILSGSNTITVNDGSLSGTESAINFN